jgi:two-component system NarL family response regulator
MPAAHGTIDYRLRDGRHSFGVRNQATDSAVESRIREVVQKDALQRKLLENKAQTRDPLPVHGVVRRSNGGVRNIDIEEQSIGNPQTALPLTVLVADDHPMVREGLAAVINRQSDMEVIAEASNGREAVEKFLALRPAIALVDLRMPLMDGIEAVMSIYEQIPGARLVVVTTYQSEEDIYRALRAGAQGYVLKDAPVEDLVECIHAVGNGKTWIPPAVGAKLAMRVTDRHLTPREMEVIRALAKGKSNKEIGVALNISEGTVKVHVTHMLEKLKVTGRTEAIGAALKRGLVTVD